MQVVRHPRLAAAVLFPLVAGCASTEQAEQNESGPAPASPGAASVVTESDGVRIVHADWADLGYRWSWSSMPLLSRGADVELYEAFGDVVITLDSNTWITVIEAGTGSRRWAAQTASDLTKFESLDRVGPLLLASARPDLYILNLESGNLIARQRFDRLIGTGPAITGGLAVYGTPIGQLLAQRWGSEFGEVLPPPLDEGVLAWGYGLEGPITTDPIMVGELIAAVSRVGDVIFIDPVTASSVGRANISGGLAAEPVSDGETLYIASLDQSVYAFAPYEGRRLWRYRTASPLRHRPAVHEGVLYVSIPSEGFTAFEADTGEVIWQAEGVSGEPIATRRGDLVVWDSEQARATLLDVRRGDVIHGFDVKGLADLQADAGGFVDAPLYGVGTSGVVIRFNPR